MSYSFKLNKYYFLGFSLYSVYLFGVFSSKLSGLSFIPFLVLVLGIAFFRKEIILKKEVFYYFLSFLLLIFLCFVNSDFLDYSVYKFFMLILKFSTLFLIPFLLIKNIEDTFKGIIFTLLFFVFVSFVFSFKLFGQYDINTRLEIGIFNPIWISRAIFECLLIGLVFLKMKRFWLIPLFIICVYISFSAGSKGPILSFLICFLIYNFRQGLRNKKIKYFILVLLILFGSVLYFFPWDIIDQNSYLYQRFLVAVPDGSSEHIMEESRIVVWPKVLNLLFNQDIWPFLFGNGLGNFGSFYFGYPYNERFYPHNFILEVFVEFGAIILLLVLFLFYKFYRNSNSGFKLLFLYFFINSMFSGDLLLNEYLIFYFGFLVAESEKFQSQLKSKKETLPLISKSSVFG